MDADRLAQALSTIRDWPTRDGSMLDGPKQVAAEALAAHSAASSPAEGDLKIARDEQMGRDYIPLPGGWEVQTKGNGSTFRIFDTKTGGRMPIPLPDRILAFLERMAREVNAAAQPQPKGPALAEALRRLLKGNEWRQLQGEWAWHSKTMPANEDLTFAREALEAHNIAQAPAPVAQKPAAWTLRETLDKGETTTTGHLWFTDPKNSAWAPLYAAPCAAVGPLTCTRCVVYCQGGAGCHAGCRPISAVERERLVRDQLAANQPPVQGSQS